MADRMAILNVGGVLEQLDPPAEILRAPANDFVARFVGRERALKRLALIHVGDLDLDHGGTAAGGGPDVRTDATLREALDALLLAPSRSLRVIGGDGEDLGVLTLDRITRELSS